MTSLTCGDTLMYGMPIAPYFHGPIYETKPATPREDLEPGESPVSDTDDVPF